MLKATADLLLPTTIIGSLPRPSWFTENLGSETFLRRLMNSRYREQYIDAVAVHLRDQEVAGLDICTDGDAHYDEEVGGQSWTSYPLFHMNGLERTDPQPTVMKTGGVAFPMGHILHDYLEARIMPRVVGPIGRGDLQYTAMWKTAQRLTAKPVKFGTVTPDILAAAVDDHYYDEPFDRMMAISNALNEELHDLADAGCPVIQMEEPAIHMIPVRGKVFGKHDMADMAGVFDNTVNGLREKTEVWCHTCWGNPSQQRMFKEVQSYESALETYNGVDADVITFESTSSGMRDIPAIGRVIEEKKIAIGMIDHHSLQIERPEEIAQRIRDTLKHIPAERLILCSDCGMGREGMSRRHARYKMAALVQGANIVKRELGLPEAECLAADGRYSLVPTE
ncbi:MAG: cobalamin-independent methionine synthase II family protein [Rhodospirillaceae bacterium]|nr:cobalamin-independent methionine synthase II family protein [Rhodospirillaceae bacterium]MDE0000153.1 cobalamin-independent methionine synthase II family protein [Rhodospirillaceae bacterium]